MTNSSRTQDIRTVVSSMLGTAVQFYDFAIYGFAASLVFPHLFFPSFSSVAGVLLSLSTFAIAFIARPVGGLIFGHFGDRIGRKKSLFVTLMLMGFATLSVGLLPTYAHIGVLAPILLVLLRLLQGIALGGEWGGAVLMSVERAKPGLRGLFGAFIGSGGGWGFLMTNLVFLAVSQLPQDDFRAWGWRLPFLLSAALVIVGLYIRIKLEESEEFTRARQEGLIPKRPLAEVFRSNRKQLVLVMLGMLAPGVGFYVPVVYSVSYGVEVLGLDSSTMLSLVLCMGTLLVALPPLFGWLSDRWGPRSRRYMFVSTSVLLMGTPFVYFALLETRQYGLMLAGAIMMFVVYAANNAVMPTFFALSFPARIRYSEMSTGTTFGEVAGSSVAPIVATTIQGATGSWIGVAAYMSVAALISAVAGALLREHAPDRPTAHPDLLSVKAVEG